MAAPTRSLTFLPVKVQLLRELGVDRVGGEQATGLGVRGRQTDLRVDVQQTIRSTWRPDGRSAYHFIIEEIVFKIEFVSYCQSHEQLRLGRSGPHHHYHSTYPET